MEFVLSNEIKRKLEEGITAAKEGANKQAEKWGSKVSSRIAC
jgi:hypothetical protein